MSLTRKRISFSNIKHTDSEVFPVLWLISFWRINKLCRTWIRQQTTYCQPASIINRKHVTV